MTNEQSKVPALEKGVQEDRKGFVKGRRQILRTGAILVPTIVTLHATPAFAQSDYTMIAYRYGANAGLCRNPQFNANANPNSTAGQEFIECPDSGRGGRKDLVLDGSQTKQEADLKEIEIK